MALGDEDDVGDGAGVEHWFPPEISVPSVSKLDRDPTWPRQPALQPLCDLMPGDGRELFSSNRVSVIASSFDPGWPGVR